jgi:hypothetical protein
MASAFETALDSAGDTVTGYFTTALPIVLGIAAVSLGIKYGRRFIKGL